MPSKMQKAPPAMANYTPEQVARMEALLKEDDAKATAKHSKRIARIVNPAGWTIQKAVTDAGVVYLSVHNQACHGNSKGWSFRGTTLPLLLGELPASGAFPLSGSTLIIEEIRAWHKANPGILTP